MSAQDHYTKISLSKQELAHVYRNLFYAAQEKMQQIVPASTPYDEFVARIQNVISENLEATFDMARHALIVDGVDLAHSKVPINELLSVQEKEEMVPFDTELNQELRDLIETVEVETTEVTQLRRELPQQARAVYENLVSATDEKVTDLVNEFSKTNANLDDLEIKSLLGDSTDLNEVTQIPNKDVVREKFEEAIHNLYNLKQDLPSLQAHFADLNASIEFLTHLHEKKESKYSGNP